MMKWKLLLLKMLIQAYPIMADEKPIPEPFAVVVNHRHEALALAEKISSKPVVITFDSSKAEVENAIAYTNSDCILVFPQLVGGKMPRSIKAQGNMSSLMEAPGKGIITLFAFEKSVPEEYRYGMTQLIITDVNDPILKKDLCTKSDYLLTAFRKYGEIPNKLRGYEWLYLSAAFLYPFLQRSGEAEAYPDIVKTANLWAQEIEQLKDIDSTVDMILEQLCDYFTHEALGITIEMKKDTRVDEQQLNSLVFLANPKIFISTAKYRELLKRTGIPVSYDAVNAVLKERGILVAGNGSVGFTSKMNYYNTEGNFKRHQMVLLDASKIEVDDGITLADKM